MYPNDLLNSVNSNNTESDHFAIRKSALDGLILSTNHYLCAFVNMSLAFSLVSCNLMLVHHCQVSNNQFEYNT